MRSLALAIAVALGVTSQALAAPVSYEFNTVVALAPVPYDAFARDMRANPSQFRPGPYGFLSYDPDTQLFSLGFFGAGYGLGYSTGGAVPLALSGNLDSLQLDFFQISLEPLVPEAATATVPARLRLNGASLFVNGALNPGLSDSSLTDAVVRVTERTTGDPFYCIAVEGFPCVPTSPTQAGSATVLAIIDLHRVPEPSVSLLLGAALAALRVTRRFPRASAWR